MTVFGAPDCDDTAIARSRLEATHVPYRYVDLDSDEGAARYVESLNDGSRSTPTIVIGAEDTVETEPSLERLDALVADSGLPPLRPIAQRWFGEQSARALPIRRLPTHDGEFSLGQLRGRRFAVLLFAHHVRCLACLGYATQLRRQVTRIAAADGAVVVVVPDDDSRGAKWQRHLGSDVTIAGDPDGGWKRAVTARLRVPDASVLLVITDRFGAPRAGSQADEAGGLITPAEVAPWVEFFELECPESAPDPGWSA